MNTYVTLTAADRIALTLDGLARSVAACSNPRRPGGPMAVWLIRLIWTRVSQSQQRIVGLLTRFLAGRLRVATAPTIRAKRGAGAVTAAPRPAAKLPRRLAWLLPLVPCDAANFAAQLRIVLAEPDMVALLKASPQARRVLQPLCRMLGIEKEVLTPQDGFVPPTPIVDPPEVALAWNLGVVRRFGGDRGPKGDQPAGDQPAGDRGWRKAQAP